MSTRKPVVALVGRPNVGKSTLFNTMTGASVYAQDQLFATLDPTLRRVDIADAGPIILADTVGFIRQLPHDLVAAFRSTLEETQQAHLLLHVVDASHPERKDRIEQVNQVLAEIEADNIYQIEIYNKIDLLDDVDPHVDYDEFGRAKRIWLSSKTGNGIDLVIESLKEFFGKEFVHCWVKLDLTDAKLRAKFYELGVVVREDDPRDGGFLLEVSMQKHRLEQLVSNKRNILPFTQEVSNTG